MSNTREKGNRRERQAAEIYESAGYEVERSYDQRFGRTDFFGHFDLMAVRRDGLRFVQVKSNEVQGIADVNRWARQWAPPGALFDFLVCYDREGWRLIRCWPDGDTHSTAVDERELGCDMGEGVTAWLQVGDSDV